MLLRSEEVLDEGNCGEMTNRGEEAGVKSARLRTETSYQGRRGQASGPDVTKPFYRAAKVNEELAQGRFTFLSGEGCPTYL